MGEFVGRKRDAEVDCFKGILILCVLFAHEVSSIRFFYWFHMPLFFAVAGYYLRETDNFLRWIKEKFVRLAVPYFAHFAALTLIGLNDEFSKSQVVSLFWGGRRLTGYVGVWWFPTCFFCRLQDLRLLSSSLTEKYSG